MYKIPAARDHDVVGLFRERDSVVLHNLLRELQQALISCAESLQYEASNLPASQMGQTVLPEKFTKKQQLQSRLDGGLELDGTRRLLLESTPQELPGHHVREHSRAHAEQRPLLSFYSQVPLQGCHQSLMPTYRLPQSVCSVTPLDEVGMTNEAQRVAVTTKAFSWYAQEESDRIAGLAHPPVGAGGGQQPVELLPHEEHSRAGQPVNFQDLVTDARSFALSFGRDFRALHQLNHDHDCTSTCIKYVQKKCKESAEEALRRGRVVACRFFFFHIVTFACDAFENVIKRIRRRGKKLVGTAHVASTNDRNEFGKVVVVRHTPFRSATTDVGQVWGRCNIDFQFMPRTLDPELFFTNSTEAALVPQTDPKLALAMYGVRLQLPDAPLLRRCFHSIVAMHQAAHNCDFYITKYQGKPMEQLQGLLSHIAVGLRRLEEEIAVADTEPSAEERARKTTLRIATAANRCSWCSVCELACYITTGSLARKTHQPVAIFLSRPMYMLQECRRLLQRGDQILLDAPNCSYDDVRVVDVLAFTVVASSNNVSEAAASSAAQPAVAVPSSSSAGDSAEQFGGQPPDMDEEEIAADGSAVEALDDGAASPEQHAEPHGRSSPFIGTSLQEEGGNPDELMDNVEITTLTNTTNGYDDWLHRGPFLFDFDLHTYVSYVQRTPRPLKARLLDTQRVEHVFAFDDHYELAKSHWQQLKTRGKSTLPMLEALRCPPPDMNNGEDNAVYKTLVGTLLACPGHSRCNDPLLYRPAFFPPNHPTSLNCRQQWKARRAEIEVLAVRAEEKSNAAKRLPVVADTILCRTFTSGTVDAPPAPPSDLLCCLCQWWIQQCGRALPCFAPRIVAFLDFSFYHEHQLTVAEFSAYHLRSVIQHLDGLTIARTTKLTTGCKEHAEDELVEAPTGNPNAVVTEFHGGEGVEPDEPEDELVDVAERSSPLFGALPVNKLTKILTRVRELEAANRPGRKSQELKQMKAFDELFHTVLHSLSPTNDVKLSMVQRSYGLSGAGLIAALDMQDAIMKHMKSTASLQSDGSTDGIDLSILDAVVGNLQRQPQCQWVELSDALRGPAHVARMLVVRCQERLHYKLNAEQLQCVALFVDRLNKAFLERPDLSQPWLHTGRVLMTMIMDGGGGCGKTTLSTEVVLPLLETFFHPEGVLRRAPSNKPARLIGGRTMHSGQGLTPESSMRTHALALNAQTRQKLAVTHVDAGALYVDEYSQLQGELNHAGALRTTYAREAKHNLNKDVYFKPQERWGRLPVVVYSGDHLQLPPVPASSSMLASLEGTTNEHKVGAKIFRDADLVFEFQQAMRYSDQTLIDILHTMRLPGGKALTEQQWLALKDTQVSAEQPDIPASWYHSCYCWSVISMAAFMLARQSAREARQTLFYVQAVDQAKAVIPETNTAQFYEDLLRIASIQKSKRLPPVVLFHYGMRVRLTTTIQQPFAVQDVEGTVVGFDPDPADHATKSRLRSLATSHAAEFACPMLPKAIYVKLDDCELQLLPSASCPEHPEHSPTCPLCTTAAQPGVMAIRPLPRTFKYFYSPAEKAKYVVIARKQIPLMPAAAVPLYSMQGTTADPGLVAYWFFPQQCSATIQWLIVYVMLSRPRSLSTLKSVNLTNKIRDIIEQGPPEDLVANFDKLFHDKIEATMELAREAARTHGLLPDSL